MALAIKHPEDDIAQTGLGDASSQGLRPFAAAEVYEVEAAASTEEGGGGGGDGVLVQVQGEDEVGVATLGVNGASR